MLVKLHFCYNLVLNYIDVLQAVTDPIPSLRVSGIVMSWSQPSMKLYTGGDSRHIQVWDAHSEMREQVL